MHHPRLGRSGNCGRGDRRYDPSQSNHSPHPGDFDDARLTDARPLPDTAHSQKTANDALGEICKVVAGYFKAKIGLGEACGLSVPTIIAGRDYKFHFGGKLRAVRISRFISGRDAAFNPGNRAITPCSVTEE